MINLDEQKGFLFWETAAQSVDHMVALYFFFFFISRFGFEGWIWVLISSVPCLCILFTFPMFARTQIVGTL